jgi:hypothetical protein
MNDYSLDSLWNAAVPCFLDRDRNEMTDRSHKALGCLPPHPADKSKRVMFTSVFGADRPPAEPARDWTDGETSRPEFGNDKVGDCTIAAVANIIIGSLKESFGKEWYPTTEEALALYYKLTGGADTGLVIEDVLKYVMNNDAFGHHFIGTAAIDPGDVGNIKRAVDWFGCVDLGVSLPKAWLDTDKWTMDGYFALSPKWKPGSWGGHSVCSEKYDADFLYVWSWGEIIPVSWDAVGLYFDSVDAVLTASWIHRGRSPANLDLSVLEVRMAEFKA